MKAFALALLLLPATMLTAQVNDSLDNILLKIPASWQISRQPTYTELTLFDKKQNNFCQLVIFHQQPASADMSASFQKEWEETVRSYFEAPAGVTPKQKKIKNGNTALSYAAQVTHKTNNLPYYVELEVFDCGNYVQSIMVTSGSKKHFQYFDSLWQPLVVRVKKNNSTAVTAPAAGITNAPFSGAWGKSASSPMGTDPGSVLTNAGYIRSLYNFKPDGTYTLHGETWGGYLRSNHFTVLDESGTYSISNNQLTITPSKGKIVTTDRDGKVQKTDKLDLAKRTYTWQLLYFEGLQETQLILTSKKEYFQDGGFAGSTAFPNSYIFSQNFKDEWKIQLK